MAELATIARPYAEALFEIAAAGDLNAWSARVTELAELARLPEVLSLASNPKVAPQQFADFIAAALHTPLDEPAKNFVRMLIANHRIELLPAIATQFFELKNAREGAADAEIVSAFPLDGAPLDELVAALAKRFGRKLKPVVTVDPSLIGGVRVVVGDEVLDTSVSARLARMQTALTN